MEHSHELFLAGFVRNGYELGLFARPGFLRNQLHLRGTTKCVSAFATQKSASHQDFLLNRTF
jgi:hypothetical protein